MARLGYYAHAHGSGHCRYADYIGSLLHDKVTVFTSRDFDFAHAQKVIKLPSDILSDDELPIHLVDPPKYLHYAPVGFAPILERSRRVLDVVREHKLDAVLVDVSVEIAALLRVSSVPYLCRRMPGYRTDLAHEEAYRGALGLVAYYPEFMETPGTPHWVRDKTVYLGFKPEPQEATTPIRPLRASLDIPENRTILSVVTGFGGAERVEKVLPEIRRAYPDYFILGIGAFSPESKKFLDHTEGVVTDVRPYLWQSDVVVGACGSNLVTEALRSRTPFVPVPCARPFREQEAIAEALQRAGLCISLKAFLAGEVPVPVGEDRLEKTMTHQYHAYFSRVATAVDWRELTFEAMNTRLSKTNA